MKSIDKRKKIKGLAVCLSMAVITVACLQCQSGNIATALSKNGASVNSYFIGGTAQEQEMLRELFTLLAGQNGDSREQLAIVGEIAAIYLAQGEFGTLVNFLNDRLHAAPDDPYNAYYLFMIAFAHQQMGSEPVAALYFDLIVRNYPDLEIQGRSIHLVSLQHLITMVEDPRQRVWYYEELITRFREQTDSAPAFFMLGQSYAALGEWDSAIGAYTRFLAHAQPGASVSGFNDAYSYARLLVDLSNSPRDWTFASLDQLVQAVRSALDAGAPAQLMRYHARANFFTRTWENEDSAVETNAGHATFSVTDFMRRSRIQYANNIEISPNGNEAFLRTWGWHPFLPVWYFYFRRVHFPPDPEIHGRWEWAGVFYGERL